MARKILIVDSSSTMRKIIGSMIMANLSDVRIAEAKNAYEAWDQLKANDFQLMLFSWEPSGATWLNFFLQLKKRPIEQQTGSILLTSDATRPYVKEAKSAGITETLIIPCAKFELTNAINRVCNPMGLRQSNRYSLPDTTALLQQEGRNYHASVVNISKGGLFCEFEYLEDYKLTAPVTITVTFQLNGKQSVVKGLYSILTRYCVLDTHTDHSPNRIRMAYRFTKVPPAMQDVFEKVFEFADEQENLLQ
jgi:DNA-binding NarL/FixJ family response regulator